MKIFKKYGRFRGLLALAAMALAAFLLVPGPVEAQQSGCKIPSGGKVAKQRIVNFEVGQTAISEKHKKELDELIARWKEHPSLEVCLLGQADRSGDEAANLKLAQKRAETVAAYMKSKGMTSPTYQVIARGQAYSDSSWVGNLLGNEPSEADRRVEVTIIER